MIRLAVCGDEAQWQMVSARLRGGSVTCSLGTADSHLSPAACDAALLVAPGLREIGLIERVLSHGKHVLLASPTELQLADLKRCSSTAQQAGVQFAVLNAERYLPSRQLLRQQLDAGKLGRPGLVRMYRWEPPPAIPSHPRQSVPAALVLDLDLSKWYVGLMPNVVYATTACPSTPDVGSGRTIQIHLGFPNNAMALIGYSSALPPGDDYRSLSIMGSAGAAYADDHQNMQLLYRGQHPQAVRAEEGIRPLVNLAQFFVDALESKTDLAPLFDDWQLTRTLTEAVEQSLISRQAISLEGA